MIATYFVKKNFYFCFCWREKLAKRNITNYSRNRLQWIFNVIFLIWFHYFSPISYLIISLSCVLCMLMLTSLFVCILDTLKKDMFEEKSISEESPKAPKSSQLSQLLEDTMYQPSNPYLDYAKFDGEVAMFYFQFQISYVSI